MSVGTVAPKSEKRLNSGGNGRPPFDRNHGDGGGWHGGGDGLPDYSERLRRYRFGLSIALVSIVMLFVCMGTAFLFRQGFSSYDPTTGSYIREWQPVQLPLTILWFNTVVLILSSATIEIARRRVVRRAAIAPALRIVGGVKDEHREPWLLLTTALGFTFLAGQVIAWKLIRQHFVGSNVTSESFFYILTGTHAIHLIAGLITLLYALLLPWLGKSLEHQRVIVDVVSWYWHVLIVLWIYLFTLLALAA